MSATVVCHSHLVHACKGDAVLQGLALLHKQGIVHGDVKGDNVMVTMLEDGSQPHAVLVDFGSTMSLKQSESLARLLDSKCFTAMQI